MRAHGTRACYIFGVWTGSDRSLGCRCPFCTEANRTYNRERERRKRRPDEEFLPAYVDCSEARTHLRFLESKGVGLRTVARASGVSRSALQKIRLRKVRRSTQETIDRILLVFPADAADGARVDAKPTWKLLNDLIAHGHTKTELARLLGSTAKVPAIQVGTEFCTQANARKVKALHERLMLRVLVDREHQAKRRAALRQAS